MKSINSNNVTYDSRIIKWYKYWILKNVNPSWLCHKVGPTVNSNTPISKIPNNDISMKIHDRWNFIRLSFRARPASININFHCHALFTTRCRFWRSRFIPVSSEPFNKFRCAARTGACSPKRSAISPERESKLFSLITYYLFTVDPSDKRTIFAI